MQLEKGLSLLLEENLLFQGVKKFLPDLQKF